MTLPTVGAGACAIRAVSVGESGSADNPTYQSRFSVEKACDMALQRSTAKPKRAPNVGAMASDVLGTTLGPAAYLGSIVRLDSRGEIVQRWKIRDRKCTIGSHRDSAIHIDDANLHPCHAVIVFGTQHVILKALASSVLLNQSPLREGVLGPGDAIDIGTVRLRVESIFHAETASRTTLHSNFDADGSLRDLAWETRNSRLPGSQRVSSPLRFSSATLSNQRDPNNERVDSIAERPLPLNSKDATHSATSGSISPELLTTCIDRFSQSMVGALERWNEQLDQRLRAIVPGQPANFTPASGPAEPATQEARSQRVATDSSQSLLKIQMDFEKRVQRIWRKQRRWFIQQQEQLKNNFPAIAAGPSEETETFWKGAHEATTQQIEGLLLRLNQLETKIETFGREIPALENVMQEYRAKQELGENVSRSNEQAESYALLQQQTEQLTRDLVEQRQLSQHLVDQVERLAEQLLKTTESPAKIVSEDRNEDLANDLNMLRVRQEFIESEIGRLDGELDSLKLQSPSSNATTNHVARTPVDTSTEEEELPAENYWQPAALNEKIEEDLPSPYRLSSPSQSSSLNLNGAESVEPYPVLDSSYAEEDPSQPTDIGLWQPHMVDVGDSATFESDPSPVVDALPDETSYSTVNDAPISLSGGSPSVSPAPIDEVYPSWMERPERAINAIAPPIGVSPLFGDSAASGSAFTSEDSAESSSLDSDPFDLSKKFTGSWFQPEVDTIDDFSKSDSEDGELAYRLSQTPVEDDASVDDDHSAWQPSQLFPNANAIAGNPHATGAFHQAQSSAAIEETPSVIEPENEDQELSQPGLSALESLRAELASLYEKEAAEAATNTPSELFPKKTDSFVAVSQARSESDKTAHRSQPVSSAPSRGSTAEPVHHKESHSSDEDQSVEHYMQQLLARMRGESNTPIAQPTPQKEVLSPPASTKSLRETRLQALAKPMPTREPSGDPEAPKNRLSEKIEDAKLNRVAAESGVNLVAFRELANHSARSAIQTSTRKTFALPYGLKVTVASVSLLAGIGLFVFNGPKVNLVLIAAFFAVSLGLVWGWDAIRSRTAKPKV